MSMRLPDYIRFPLVLVIVAGVSALALALINAATEPGKLRMQQAMTERALKMVMPAAASFEEVAIPLDDGLFTYRKALGEGDELMGYVAEGSAEGYSSRIRVIVGVSPDFSINAIQVISQKETPGLGDKIEEILSKRTWWTVLTRTSPDESNVRPWFQVQFDGRMTPVNLERQDGAIEAITGATISSRAVCDAVNNAVARLKQALRHA